MKLKTLIFAVAAMLFLPIGVWAAPKTADDAKQVTVDWLKRDPRPLGETLGQRVKEVQTFKDDKGEPMYHVVNLDPAGFVIVPADDLVEPVIAFASQGRFDPSTSNPLGAFVSCDVPARVAHARALRTAAPTGHFLEAQNNWKRLQSAQNANTNEPAPPNGINAVSDLRIAPLLQTVWDQGTAGATGIALYNYYTPPYAAGTSSNYPCGCVATALAQLLGYFQYPKAGVGTNSFAISVNGTNTTARLRGGDGAGGPYCWSNMPPNPNNPTTAQCQAIGALMYDAAVSEQMGFAPGGSGANVGQPQVALMQTFMYNNAIFGWPTNASEFDPSLVTMVNANLDARLPVCVALNGHQVVTDGYGYNLSTLYNHINMGWGGVDNAWYALPVVQTYTNLWGFIYNIYTNGSGEIISGRIISGGIPLSNATVTAYRVGGGTYTATTDTNGIYALVCVPSASQYAIEVNLTYFISAFSNCATGTSWNYNICSGNVWGEDFSLVPWIWPPLIMVQPNNLVTNVGSAVTFNVTALSQNPLSYQWQILEGGGSTNWNNLNDGTIYSGSQSSNLVVNVQSVAMNGFQFRCVVTNSSGSMTSSVAQLTAVGLSPNCAVAAPAGLISWWTGDVTPDDAVGTNNGTLQNGVTYAPGEVGYAFSFDGTGSVSIPDSPSFQSLTNAMSFGAWIKVPGWNNTLECVFSKGLPWALQRNWNTNSLLFSTEGLNTVDLQGNIPVDDGNWHYVVAGYDGLSKFIYVDGVLDVQVAASGSIMTSTFPAVIGDDPYWGSRPFTGLIDEVTLYNRALTSNEIVAIYQAGTNGMCAPSPAPSFLSTMPLDQTLRIGATASFSAIAECSVPVAYQWHKNGQPISQATGSAYCFGPTQSGDAGQYYVVASNQFGMASSRVATLSINSPCAVSAPSGLVSWWAGEGNADDLMGTNTGTFQNGATYAPGKVGYAFSFNGVNQSVNVPYNTNFNFSPSGQFSVEAWVIVNSITSYQAIAVKCPASDTWDWGVYIIPGGNFMVGSHNGFAVVSSITAQTGQWYNVCVTYNNASWQLFVNGLTAAQGSGVSILQSSGGLGIGCKGQSTVYYDFLAGLVDEIQIYNRALTASEIQAIYQAGTNGMCAPTPLMFTGSPSYNKTNGFVLNASLRSSQSYHIQANTNLASTNWTTLTNFTAGTAPIFHYTNKPPTNTLQQFYRIVSP